MQRSIYIETQLVVSQYHANVVEWSSNDHTCTFSNSQRLGKAASSELGCSSHLVQWFDILAPLITSLHTRSNLRTSRQIRQHGIILLTCTSLGAILLFQRAHDAHATHGSTSNLLSTACVHLLVRTTSSTRSKRTLVPKPKLSMLRTLTTTVTTNLAVRQSLRKLVLEMSLCQCSRNVFGHVHVWIVVGDWLDCGIWGCGVLVGMVA